LDLVSFLALFAKLLIATESRINKNEKGVAIEVFLADWGKEPKIGKRAGFLYYFIPPLKSSHIFSIVKI
jgi:hypothetical protein